MHNCIKGFVFGFQNFTRLNFFFEMGKHSLLKKSKKESCPPDSSRSFMSNSHSELKNHAHISDKGNYSW